MKRVAMLLLALTLALAGCSSDVPVDGTPVDTENAPVTVSVIGGGLSEYIIVRPDFAADGEIDAAVALRRGLQTATGVELPLTNDADMMYGADADGARLLIVGDSSLAGAEGDVYSEAAKSELNAGEFRVKVFADGIIALNAASEKALMRGVDHLVSLAAADGLTLAADYAYVGSFAAPSSDYSDFTPAVRFIAASDVHFKESDSVERERLALMFDYAYAYADGETYKNIDAAVFAGDVTDHGSIKELTAFREAVESKLRGETKFICAMGNHEFFGGSQALFERVIGQSADQVNVINGFTFITVSPSDGSDYSPKYDWLNENLSTTVDSAPELPVFVFQHHHIKDTVYVSEEWYTDQLDEVYSDYPNIIDFSGHSHGPVNNPRSIYQDKYTSLGTGTLSYFEMNSGMTYGTIPPNASDAAQFYIVEADAAGRVRILPFNILTGDFFTCQNSGKPDERLVYTVDRPSDPESFIYTRERWETSEAPYFDADAELSYGLTANNTRLTVEFPQAHDDACVYSYTVTAQGNGVTKSTSIFSEYYFEPMPERLTVQLTAIKPGDYEITVVAYDCYGVPSEPLTATFTAQ